MAEKIHRPASPDFVLFGPAKVSSVFGLPAGEEIAGRICRTENTTTLREIVKDIRNNAT